MAISPSPATTAFIWSLSFPFGSRAILSTTLSAQLFAFPSPSLAIIEAINDWL